MAMVLSRERETCPLWVGEQSLPQVKDFQYRKDLFMSEGKKMEKRIDREVDWGCDHSDQRSHYRSGGEGSDEP